ncbi:MAG TPA: hypothetical protein ENG00_01450 [Candidatus Aenigmarchaeota archaeon]|nr:hypothetical protein [Candidatus Aenigmarchaeota archaeon]
MPGGGKETTLPQYKRHIFRRIKKYLDKKQIIAIVGLRRVGKTVLMKQMIDEIKNKKRKGYLTEKAYFLSLHGCFFWLCSYL